MLVLSRETGKRVRSADGSQVGRLRDLTMRIGTDHPTVDRLVVSTADRQPLLLPWAAVAAFEPDAVTVDLPPKVTPFGGDSDLETDELLLHRDVLDTQIFDVRNHRMTRVSDVLLNRTPDGRLELVAVDVSLRAVVRRLGLGRLAEHLPEDAVDWGDLHLTSTRGHDIQLATSTAAVHRLDAHGLAQLITRLNLEDAHDVIRTVGRTRAAEAVSMTHPDVRGRLEPALHPLSTPSPRRRFLRHRGWRHNRPLRVGRD
ncbi:sporulation protein YlmC with PRC-barrel domain [Nocardioides ginsengisegetis]|uniref:Sporulation protein YlmC with PRC-barrel domain n=1 Tax=Nocardioides ginsengisegetis TaxID=661491 RepID=A0A7W3P948_9ACTN|nr:magnesium transporter [Nocardioides ginsengisegetis]MBA8803310.1 sporulation protein YlmC with PRC-barrel domain [Nocardioides ginsengisegetis]